MSVPATGRALVSLELDLVGVGPASAGIHGWSASVQAGDPSFDRIINFGAGEDLCPGETLTRKLLAYSKLTATHDRRVHWPSRSLNKGSWHRPAEGEGRAAVASVGDR